MLDFSGLINYNMFGGRVCLGTLLTRIPFYGGNLAHQLYP